MELGEGQTRCYWLEPNGLGRVGLRRFTYSTQSPPCAAGPGGCDATHVRRATHPIPWLPDEDGYVTLRSPEQVGLAVPHSSSSWPRRCEACGNRFPRGAQWQEHWHEGFVRADTGETIWTRHVHGRELAGALYDARWLHDVGGQARNVQDRGDGIVLAAVCPNGLPWIVDAEATGGGFWERTGDPRQPETLTASPSIRAGEYHGHLVAGVFSGHEG